MNASDVEQVRSFNRIVAERLGALRDRFLGRTRPMPEARVLWEIGFSSIEVRELLGRLSLDSESLNRILSSLERRGLVAVSSQHGKRVQFVRLTRRGLAEREELDRRSDDLALQILDTFTERQRNSFLSAIGEAERLLQASMISFAIEDPSAPDAIWCLNQYFAELSTRFEAGFDPARSISAVAPDLTPPAGALFIARMRGNAVGCGALKFHPGHPAELKRMWMAPSVRGLGAGRRMLRVLEDYARSEGATTLRLETNRTLSEALALYRSAGYVEVHAFNTEPFAHHWFEKSLT
jgi:DNA-binding MarR family transcriptional regulator/GNAT superfamily N-acetyltransferase